MLNAFLPQKSRLRSILVKVSMIQLAIHHTRPVVHAGLRFLKEEPEGLGDRCGNTRVGGQPLDEGPSPSWARAQHQSQQSRGADEAFSLAGHEVASQRSGDRHHETQRIQEAHRHNWHAGYSDVRNLYQKVPGLSIDLDFTTTHFASTFTQPPSLKSTTSEALRPGNQPLDDTQSLATRSHTLLPGSEVVPTTQLVSAKHQPDDSRDIFTNYPNYSQARQAHQLRRTSESNPAQPADHVRIDVSDRLKGVETPYIGTYYGFKKTTLISPPDSTRRRQLVVAAEAALGMNQIKKLGLQGKYNELSSNLQTMNLPVAQNYRGSAKGWTDIVVDSALHAILATLCRIRILHFVCKPRPFKDFDGLENAQRKAFDALAILLEGLVFPDTEKKTVTVSDPSVKRMAQALRTIDKKNPSLKTSFSWYATIYWIEQWTIGLFEQLLCPMSGELHRDLKKLLGDKSLELGRLETPAVPENYVVKFPTPFTLLLDPERPITILTMAMNSGQHHLRPSGRKQPVLSKCPRLPCKEVVWHRDLSGTSTTGIEILESSRDTGSQVSAVKFLDYHNKQAKARKRPVHQIQTQDSELQGSSKDSRLRMDRGNSIIEEPHH